ncbi:hypothetical protein EES47_22425 [Streptomyces sp. ADI98-12]|nr:hypothetical protein EES47_22425 [Streptomyces sp. ADI98-12]
MVGLLVAFGHPLGVDDVVGAEHLGVLVVLVLELVGPGGVGDLQDALGVGDAFLPFGLGGGAGGRVVLAEEFGGLVQERHVGRGPLPALAADRGGLALGQVGGVGEIAREELLGGELGPERADGRVDLRAGGDLLGELGHVGGVQQVGAAVGIGAEAVGELGGERVDDPEGEVRAGQVVRQSGGAGPLARLGGRRAVQVEGAVVVVVDLQHLVRHGLPVGDGPGQRLGHLRPPLDLRGPGGVGAPCLDAGEQLAEGGEPDAGLAERGQYLADVAEEGRVRADDEHGAAGQLLPVGVQEVGGAVQGDGGLAGAGAALDDEDALVRGADDAVLLRLDGLHDVGHPAGAGGAERGEQDGVAVGVLVAGAPLVAQVEDLVVQRGDRAALGGEVAAPAQPHRGVAGGQVEGPGDRCPPVDEDRSAFGVLLPDSDTADVPAGPVPEIQPAETEPGIHGVQRRRGQPVLGDRHVPFEPGLLPRGDLRQRRSDGVVLSGATGVEEGVQVGDEGLLRPQFRVVPALCAIPLPLG